MEVIAFRIGAGFDAYAREVDGIIDALFSSGFGHGVVVGNAGDGAFASLFGHFGAAIESIGTVKKHLVRGDVVFELYITAIEGFAVGTGRSGAVSDFSCFAGADIETPGAMQFFGGWVFRNHGLAIIADREHVILFGEDAIPFITRLIGVQTLTKIGSSDGVKKIGDLGALVVPRIDGRGIACVPVMVVVLVFAVGFAGEGNFEVTVAKGRETKVRDVGVGASDNTRVEELITGVFV